MKNYRIIEQEYETGMGLKRIVFRTEREDGIDAWNSFGNRWLSSYDDAIAQINSDKASDLTPTKQTIHLITNKK